MKRFFTKVFFISLALFLSFYIVKTQFFSPHISKEIATNKVLSAENFLLQDYSEVAIATDLEPDDVFALKILFQKANYLYKKHPSQGYPIQLIIVGEGNTNIKKLRMEKLLQKYLEVPSGIHIPVVEGAATKENIFPLDGEEMFSREFLAKIPFPSPQKEEIGERAFENWVRQAKKPFVIQLKPAPELFILDRDLAKKTSVLFYGSFNLRKVVDDPKIVQNPDLALGSIDSNPQKLQAAINYLANRYEKMAILETYGVLGDNPCVCEEFPWTRKIQEQIATSQNPFLQMFRTLCDNWNTYILQKNTAYLEKMSSRFMKEKGPSSTFFAEIHKEAIQMKNKNSYKGFKELYPKLQAEFERVEKNIPLSEKAIWKKMLIYTKLGKRIAESKVQFTFADVLVALATTESSYILKAEPVHLSYDENGFLIPTKEEGSNLVYYGRASKEKIAKAVEDFLFSIEEKQP